MVVFVCEGGGASNPTEAENRGNRQVRSDAVIGIENRGIRQVRVDAVTGAENRGIRQVRVDAVTVH